MDRLFDNPRWFVGGLGAQNIVRYKVRVLLRHAQHTLRVGKLFALIDGRNPHVVNPSVSQIVNAKIVIILVELGRKNRCLLEIELP